MKHFTRNGLTLKGRLSLFLLFAAVLMNGQIIVNHEDVDLWDDIPQQYIDIIKTKWLSYAGESHSEGIRYGLEALESLDPRYQVNVTESGTPEASTTSHLRASRATWGDVNYTSGWFYDYGEEDWWTSSTAVTRTKDGLTYMNENGFELDYFAFGWCYDAAVPYNVFSASYDPVYAVRWMGESLGSATEGVWGLDDDDNSITGNDVNMQTYIDATIEYINHCQTNGYPTKVFFTTGPVDNEYLTADDEPGYQQYLKYEYIRNVVASSDDYMLFDYADILCWNDAGEESTTQWTDNNSTVQTFPMIHSDNLGGTYVAHIGSVGALRLGKAMWVFLARLEGWDGVAVPVTQIQISTEGDATEIQAGETLQFYAAVSPENASKKEVDWSVDPGTGDASITGEGVLTALAEGTVDVVASARDGSGVSSTFALNILGGPLGLSGLKEKNALKLYPNPSGGIFYLDPGARAIERIEVLNALGTVIREIVAEPQKALIEFDISNEVPGIYFIRAIDNGQVLVQSLMISR